MNSPAFQKVGKTQSIRAQHSGSMLSPQDGCFDNGPLASYNDGLTTMGKGIRISKVYTRTGDSGQTSLVGGRRVSKASLRVEAYGEVDELNSVTGLARSFLEDAEIDSTLASIQNDLFTVGADLASPAEVEAPRVEQTHIARLEKLSDEFLAQLEPLKEFILPGGCRAGASLHLARTIARRAERRAVALGETEEINPQTIVYLNRLSDLLFILARVVNNRASVGEKMTDFSNRGQGAGDRGQGTDG